MTNLSNTALEVLAALRAAAEGCTCEDAEGFVWKDVYLDNVNVAGVTGRQMSGYISALADAGFYVVNGSYFGRVKMEKKEEVGKWEVETDPIALAAYEAREAEFIRRSRTSSLAKRLTKRFI